MDTEHHIFGVLGGPDTLCAVECQIERVLADNTDGGHGDLDSAAAIVTVHHHQIGSDLVPGDNVAVGHPGQHPGLAATLQGSGSLIGHANPQQVIGELESVLVLHHLVAVRNDTKGGVVGTAGIDLVPRDQGAVLSVDVLLLHRPVKASKHQGVNGRGRGFDTGSQSVPGLFADIEHGFDVSGHNFYLLK